MLSASQASSPADAAVRDYLDTSPARRRTCAKDEEGGTAGGLSAQAILQTLPPASCAQLPSILSKKLAAAVLADLASTDCKWDSTSRLCALRILKELSRLPEASRTLASQDDVVALTLLIEQISAIDESSSSARGTKNRDEQDLALRVLNNVLLQHADARHSFSLSSRGMACAVQILNASQSPTLTFLAARLVFFATLVETETLRAAVEQQSVVSIFAKRLHSLLEQDQTPEVESAVTELQKAFFNIGVYYRRTGRVSQSGGSPIGDNFEEALLPFLLPTVKTLTRMRRPKAMPLVSPWTNAIGVLLNYPIRPYQSIWSESDANQHCSPSGSLETPSSTVSAADRARRVATSLFRPSSKGKASNPGVDTKPSVVSVLLQMIDSATRSLFVTGDVDDGSAETKAAALALDLEPALEPALLLLRKLSTEAEDFRSVIKTRILPPDIDRTSGLERREDLTGIMVRLMSSVNFPRLARASGEVLLAACGGEASRLTAEIGYGPCAGFLVSIGQGHVLPSGYEKLAGKEQRVVDPFTGKFIPSAEELARQDAESGLAAMTEEEKEAEAERLFGLFDRLERTGVVKVSMTNGQQQGEQQLQHPVRQAVETGRMQELDAAEEEAEMARLAREDDELETTVDREMRAFRDKEKRQRAQNNAAACGS